MCSMSSGNGLVATDKIVFFNNVGLVISIGGRYWALEIDVINVFDWKSVFEDSDHVVVVSVISCSCGKDIKVLKELGHRFLWSAPSNSF